MGNSILLKWVNDKKYSNEEEKSIHRLTKATLRGTIRLNEYVWANFVWIRLGELLIMFTNSLRELFYSKLPGKTRQNICISGKLPGEVKSRDVY